jgi:hypothetical protein
MTQTVKDLIDAQEEQGGDAVTSAALLAAANTWKRARQAYRQHIHEHGCLDTHGDSSLPAESRRGAL